MLKVIANSDDLFIGSLNETYELVLKAIHESCWNYIETHAKSAADKDQLETVVLSVLTRDFVDKFLDSLIENFNVKDLIKDKYEELQVGDNFIERVEEEDKALQEKFSDKSQYNEEIDENKDLELAEAGTAYAIKDDGTIDEITRPDDVEDPNLDTENDESVEIEEDSLTEEEKAAGIHFNKSGRKIDKRGRFVK